MFVVGNGMGKTHARANYECNYARYIAVAFKSSKPNQSSCYKFDCSICVCEDKGSTRTKQHNRNENSQLFVISLQQKCEWMRVVGSQLLLIRCTTISNCTISLLYIVVLSLPPLFSSTRRIHFAQWTCHWMPEYGNKCLENDMCVVFAPLEHIRNNHQFCFVNMKKRIFRIVCFRSVYSCYSTFLCLHIRRIGTQQMASYASKTVTEIR